MFLSLLVGNVLNPAAFAGAGVGIPGTCTDPNHSGVPVGLGVLIQ